MGDVYVWDGAQLVPAVAAQNRTGPGGDTQTGGLVGIYNGYGTSDDVTIADAAAVHFNLGSSYYNAGQTSQLLATWDEARLARDTQPIVAMASKNYQGGGENSFMEWSKIPSGQYDETIETWATTLASYRVPLWFAFDIEPEVKINRGDVPDTWTTEEFAQAYRHIVGVMRPIAANVDFCYWVGGSDRTKIAAMYPGDDVIDRIGWDPYVSQHESPDQTPLQCWGSFNSWLDGRSWGYNKSRGLFETGFDSRFGKKPGIAFWEAAPAAFRDLDLSWVILFNRDSGPNTNAKITDPDVMAAYGAAMRAIQAGETG